MADRVIRDELWSSDRFLDLPTDTCRVVFVRIVSLADDFGNFEGGSRRLFRILHACTQIKTEASAMEVLGTLIESDLLRRYTVEDREFFHIPRFRSHRQYLSRFCPPSPWCDNNQILGKHKRVIDKGLAKNLTTTTIQHSSDAALCSGDEAEGVGVGVGVGVGDGVGVLDVERSKTGNVKSAKQRLVAKETSKPEHPPSAEIIPGGNGAKPPAASLDMAWEAYAKAYQGRYGEKTARTGRTNAMLTKLVGSLGPEQAPAIATFYVGLARWKYAERKHALAALLEDLDAIRTSFETGEPIPEPGLADVLDDDVPWVEHAVTTVGNEP